MIIYPSNQSKIIEIEEQSLNAWPAISEIYHKGCILRFSNGYTKRANSINPLYFTDNCHEIIQYAEDNYTSRSLPTVFKIIKHKRYEVLDSILHDNGYLIIDHTNVKLIDLRTNNFEDNNHVQINNHFSDKWIHSFISSNNLEQKSETIENILKKIEVDKVIASITIDNKIIGFGFGAIENDIVGIFDIFVNKQYRNNGYGRMIMNKLLYTVKKSKCSYSYLQVMNDNVIATKLYQSLGYKQYYKYWYRVKPNERRRTTAST